MFSYKILIAVLSAIFFGALGNETRAQDTEKLRVEAVVKNLRSPWSFGFLPDQALLVTERGGRMRFIAADGTRKNVSGVPKVQDGGQGGLLDVLIPRDFSQRREIFWTFSKSQSNGVGTAVAKGRLSKDGGRLSDVKVIFEMSEGSSGGRHFGSRLVEAADGTLFVTIGDRGEAEAAQDLGRHNGAIIRIARDGSPTSKNPFVGTKNAAPEIWSYGHRNPQGMAFDAQGRLWAVEHGAKGGDEINRIQKGANFGWPVIAYGRHYSGRKIGEGTKKQGMKQPAFYWDPSIAPSGMMIYSGKLWPQWRGNFFVGSLKFDYVSRLAGAPMREQGKIETSETKRVRDVREGPAGGIWFLSEDRGTLYRITPSP
ncbi:MAG: PQQ-dependent sugar dehydrogenase [Shimia sp.]|uniref:PQQ-dependent sugar dehydrogenase n=1 Tax=Shimia sp. TaxID=1954381 RepID=UPI004059147A